MRLISFTSILLTLTIGSLSLRGLLPIHYKDILSLLLNFFNVVLCVYVISMIKSSIRFIFLNLYFILYFLLYSYWYRTGSSFDVSVAFDNLSLIFYKESFGVIGNTLNKKDYLIIVLFLILLIYLQIKKRLFQHNKFNYKPIICLLLLWSGLYFYPKFHYDIISDLFIGVHKYVFYKDKSLDCKLEQLKTNSYIKSISYNQKKNKNLIVIFVESFNANYFESKIDDKHVMPFLNELKNKGVYIPRFYGNSVQTIKGKFAALCGLLPITRHKVATHYPNTALNCLPNILRDNNYSTYYLRGHQHMDFDNTQNFMKHIGFSYVAPVDLEATSELELKYRIWGWGADDYLLYEQSIRKLKEHKEHSPSKPFMLALITLSTHQTFNLPEELRRIYLKPKSKQERYINALAYTDETIKFFYDQLYKQRLLEDTIFVVMGDHSFPMGEHGYYNNERGFNEESFRTPFLMFSFDLQPQVINKVNDQVGFSPTMLETLGVEAANNHFIGKSYFSKKDSDPIYLVQPYSGQYLAIIKDNFKYIKHIKTGSEWLYNLSQDKLERNNLIDHPQLESNIIDFRNRLQQFSVNDCLIQNNKVMEKY